MRYLFVLLSLLCSIEAIAQSNQKLENSEIERAFVRSDTKEVQILIDDAKPVIIEVINKISCGAQGRNLLRYTAPDATTSLYATPFVTMFKHDIDARNGCLVPMRIHGWEKVKDNYLSFIVDYESLQTGDTARRTYRMKKQIDGVWLFQW